LGQLGWLAGLGWLDGWLAGWQADWLAGLGWLCLSGWPGLGWAS
jgi:hypothetical protein